MENLDFADRFCFTFHASRQRGRSEDEKFFFVQTRFTTIESTLVASIDTANANSKILLATIDPEHAATCPAATHERSFPHGCHQRRSPQRTRDSSERQDLFWSLIAVGLADRCVLIVWIGVALVCQ